MESHSAEDIAIYRGPGTLVSTWRESPDGTWTLGEDEFSPLFPVVVNISPDLLEKASAQPVNDKFNLEIGALPIPCGRNDAGREIMARLMLAVEGATHFTMGTTIISPPDGRELDWSPAVDFALKTMVQFGYRPRHTNATSTTNANRRGLLHRAIDFCDLCTMLAMKLNNT